MPLSPDQIAHFQQEGWLAVSDFFTAREVAALQAEIAHLQDAGKLRNVATAGDGVTRTSAVANLQLCPSAPHSALIRALRSAPKTTTAIRSLIGDPVLYVLDQIFLKPPHHGAGTRWHQDNAYWHQPDPSAGTGMWIAVHAATRANGTMHIIPRSHGHLARHERDPGSDHHIHAPQVDESQALPIELPAGGVLFFNFGILHCTRANHTDHARAGLALHFANQDRVAPDFAQDSYHTPLLDRTGVLVPDAPTADQWDREVERSLALGSRSPVECT